MDQLVFIDGATVAIVAMGLLFAFSNGFRDSSTIVATVVSTRVLTPGSAFLLCAVFEFIGAFLLGSAVVMTIGVRMFGSVHPGTPNDYLFVIGAALMAAIIWGGVSWWKAWPTSNNQALIAGLMGSSLAAWGPGHFKNSTIIVVLMVLILSPLMGFLVSMLLTSLLRFLGGWATPKIMRIFKRIHVFSCMMVSLAHGSNDGQMVMGVLLLVLSLSPVFMPQSSESMIQIPWFIRLMVAVTITLGVLMGGQRILKKVGMKFYRITPPQDVGSQITSAGTILTCALAGFPASTTQVITGSIIGAGVAKNPKAVRWHIAQDIVLSWVLTIPVVGLLGSGIYYALQGILGNLI